MSFINKMDNSKIPKEQLECRMHEKEFPDVNDIVIAKVKDINEYGAIVILSEYNNLEGMIGVNELSKKRFRNINHITRIGNTEILMVLNVDKQKNYIDLSKKRINQDDIDEFNEKYDKNKKIHSIAIYAAIKNKCNLIDIYNQKIWPLAKKWGCAYYALSKAYDDPNTIFGGISDDIVNSLIEIIKKKLKPSLMKIRSEIKLVCSDGGIDSLKHIFSLAKQINKNQKDQISIKIIVCPHYLISLDTFDYEKGYSIMNDCLDILIKESKANNAEFEIIKKPFCLNHSDEMEIKKRTEQIENLKQNDNVDEILDKDSDLDSDDGFDSDSSSSSSQ